MIRRADLLWLFLVAVCLGSLISYQAQAGRAAEPPQSWPSSLEPGPHHSLVLIAHPHCPCTRATLRQLQQSALATSNNLRTYVVFVQPQGSDPNFHLGELWQFSQAIPGVTTLADAEGKISTSFGAFTSGQALLYGPDGRLEFSGGLTPSRGHEGASIGLEAIEQRLKDAATEATTSAVYGCPLSSQEKDATCHL